MTSHTLPFPVEGQRPARGFRSPRRTRRICPTDAGGRLWLSTLVLCVMATVNPALAATSKYTLGYRLEYSDNIRLSETNTESELISIPSIDYDFQHRSASWDGTILAQLQYQDYVDNTFDDRWAGVVDAALLWYLQPQRLTWVTTNYFRQVLIASRQAANPANQQLVNTFSTGPDLTLRLSAVDELRTEVRGVDIYEEQTDNDSQRLRGAVRWQHLTSPVTTWSLNYEYEDTDYDSPSNIDFIRHDYFVRYAARGARTIMTADIGGTDIRRLNAPDTNGSLARITLNYRLSRIADLALAAHDLLTEGGYVAATQGDLAELATLAGNFVSPDIYRERLVDLAYTRRGPTNNIAASFYGYDRGYRIDRSQDRRAAGVRFQVDYDPAPIIRLTLSANYRRTRYDSTEREDQDSVVSFLYQHRLGTTLYLNTELRRTERDSTAAGFSYLENRVSLGLSYRR